MTGPFQRIGLFAKHNTRSVADTFEKLVEFLKKRGHTLAVEARSATLLSAKPDSIVPQEALGEVSDLVIVVGGDGSLLNAARAIVSHQIPILGINRGRLGFLADILPENMEQELGQILEGQYLKEQRMLIKATLKRGQNIIGSGIALNDIVLYAGNIARMIDFEVTINQNFMLRQQADGLITSTPTGSTAYALSAGGPILYPTLNAITVVPMCPHTLSSRPIVVDSNSQIEIVLTKNNLIEPKLSCDGQLHFDLQANDRIFIQKHEFELSLIHPLKHTYFSVLREKLGWSAHQLKD